MDALAHLHNRKKCCDGQQQRHRQPASRSKRVPFRVSDPNTRPVDNGCMRRIEADPAQADNDGHQAVINDQALTGASYTVDSQRIGAYVLALAGGAALLYLLRRMK